MGLKLFPFPFSKIYFAVEILISCLLTIKRYFQLHKVNYSFVKPHNTQVFFVITMPTFGEIKRHSLTATYCQKYFRNESYIYKKLFSTASVKFFFCRPQNTLFFRAQITRILFFWESQFFQGTQLENKRFFKVYDELFL